MSTGFESGADRLCGQGKISKAGFHLFGKEAHLFQNPDDGQKLASLRYTIVESEQDALLLENTLIKQINHGIMSILRMINHIPLSALKMKGFQEFF